jgi:hypothetical protein
MLATHPVPIVDDEAAEPARVAVCVTCEAEGRAILLRQEYQWYGRGAEWAWRRCPNERFDGAPHARQVLA